MVSPYHTLLPTIDGEEQLPGPDYKATGASCEISDEKSVFTHDIAAAYGDEAEIESWERKLTLHRGSNIEVIDTYKLSKKPEEIVSSFLTPCNVDISEPGKIRLSNRNFGRNRKSGQGTMTYPVGRNVSFQKIHLTDAQMNSVWGTDLTRVSLIAKNPAVENSWTYLISA